MSDDYLFHTDDPIEAAYLGLVEQMADLHGGDVDEAEAETILLAADRDYEQFQADIEAARDLRNQEAKAEREARAMFDRHIGRAMARRDVMLSRGY